MSERGPIPSEEPMIDAEPEIDSLEGETESVEAPAERRSSMWSGLSETANSLWRKHFKGEVIEEEPGPVTKTDIAKALGVGMLGASASVIGVKSVADVSRYLSQSYYTSVERERLRKTFEGAAIETPLAPEAPAVSRAEVMREQIEASAYLTAAQKKEMVKKLEEILSDRDREITLSETQRNKEVAELIEANIQARVKGTTVIKETVNTALMLTGLGALRGAAYGTVAMYERYQTVSQEMAEGKREGSFAREMFVNGFGETWRKATLRGGETRAQKIKGFAEAMGTLGRVVGFGNLAIGELMDEGGVSGAIDTMLTQWEQKSAAEFMQDNFTENLDRYANLAKSLIPDAEAGDEVVGEVEDVAETNLADLAERTPVERATAGMGDVRVAEAALEPRPVGMGDVRVAEAANTAPAATFAEKAKELLSLQPEHSPAELETGLVRQGDGIVAIVARQLTMDPKSYGFTGNAENAAEVAKWAKKHAIEMSRAQGVIGQGEEMRLGKESIGKLSVVLQSENGAAKIAFVDAKTGVELPDAQRATMLYEHRTGGTPTGAEATPERPVRIAPMEAVSAAEPNLGERAFDLARVAGAEVQEFVGRLEAGELVSVPDQTPADLFFSGNQSEVQAALEAQGIVLDAAEQRITSGDGVTLDWGNIQVDPVSGDRFETARVTISQDGDAVVLRTLESNGSMQEVRYEGGKIASMEVLPPEYHEPLRVDTGSALYTRADSATRSVFDRMNNGELLMRESAEKPPIWFGGSSREEVLTALSKQGMRMDATGLSSARDTNASVRWDATLVDAETKADVLSTTQVNLSVEGDAVVVRMLNADGSKDIVKYVNGTVDSYRHLVPGVQEKPLEVVGATAPTTPIERTVETPAVGSTFVESAPPLPEYFVPQSRLPEFRTPEIGEATPPGYHRVDTPDGSLFVEDLPSGYHEEPSPDGTLYVENPPNGYKAIDTPDGRIYKLNTGAEEEPVTSDQVTPKRRRRDS